MSLSLSYDRMCTYVLYIYYYRYIYYIYAYIGRFIGSSLVQCMAKSFHCCTTFVLAQQVLQFYSCCLCFFLAASVSSVLSWHGLILTIFAFAVRCRSLCFSPSFKCVSPFSDHYIYRYTYHFFFGLDLSIFVPFLSVYQCFSISATAQVCVVARRSGEGIGRV